MSRNYAKGNGLEYGNNGRTDVKLTEGVNVSDAVVEGARIFGLRVWHSGMDGVQ